jgi:hypothetical protein
MASGENAKFMKEKSAYLQDHFIIWRDDQSLAGGKGIYDFDLTPDKTAGIVDTAGRKVKACILTPMVARGKAVSGSTNAIQAYYLPYQPNMSFHHRLVDDVDYCFTPTLNGCTFVVGSGDTPLISHYNFVDDPNAVNPTVDQAKIDRHIGRRYHAPVTTLKRADYKTGPALDYKVTIIGIREGGSWSFYYQRRAEDLQYVPGKGSSLVSIAADLCVQIR